MAIAVLCVGAARLGILQGRSERIILVRNMVGEVGSDHLFQLLGCGLVHKILVVFRVVPFVVSCAA